MKEEEENSGTPEPLSERMARCPIHQLFDVQEYMQSMEIPPELWEAFHEMVIVRGKYSWNMKTQEAKIVGQEILALGKRFNIPRKELQAMTIALKQLADQWAVYKISLN